jgi:hypothetical protein
MFVVLLPNNKGTFVLDTSYLEDALLQRLDSCTSFSNSTTIDKYRSYEPPKYDRFDA